MRKTRAGGSRDRRGQEVGEPRVLELSYRLVDLPSAQHRAGLAGLVLAAGWLKHEYDCRGICDVEVSSGGATLYIDELGLSEMFNGIYAASIEEQERFQPMKSQRTREVIPALREEFREVVDSGSGLVRVRPVYIYETIVPRGAFLVDCEPESENKSGAWLGLWREVVWTIYRGVPATRRPYEVRAGDEATTDAATAWSALCRGADHPVPLPGTYFIGAQSYNAENVPFRDRAAFQFLLHFWQLVAQIYVPEFYGGDDSIDLRGFAIAVPDVAILDRFCGLFSVMMLGRSPEPYRVRRYRPRESIIDLPEEAGLDLLRRVREAEKGDRLAGRLESDGNLGEVVAGVDVFHVEKQENMVRVLGMSHLDSVGGQVEEYGRFRGCFWSPIFRKRRLMNLIAGDKHWYEGFDEVLARTPIAQTIHSAAFRHDAELCFRQEMNWLKGEERKSNSEIVYWIVSRYLGLASPPGELVPVDGEARDSGMNSESRQRLFRMARGAFLAIRRRRGEDFIDYFISTLCGTESGQSAPDRQWAPGVDTDTIRTLTLLALAAQATVTGSVAESTEKGDRPGAGRGRRMAG